MTDEPAGSPPSAPARGTAWTALTSAAPPRRSRSAPAQPGGNPMRTEDRRVAAAHAPSRSPPAARAEGGSDARQRRLPVGGHGVDDRVRSRRRQRHHGPHDRRHHPAGRPVPREHRGREPRGRQRRHRLGLPVRPVRHGYGISTTSGSFITTPLQADTGWTYDGLHARGPVGRGQRAAPRARRQRASRPGRTGSSYAKDKGSVVVGGIGTVNVDYILHADDRRRGRLRDRVRAVQRGGSGADLAALRRHRRDGLQPRLDPRPDRGRRDERRCCSPAAERLEALPRRADRRGEGHRGPALDAARPDPAAGRARGGAGVVDRHHEGGRGDRGVAGLPRRELPHRGRALGRGLHSLPRRDAGQFEKTLKELGAL